jgi:uncharacterized membrane protein YfhO
MFDSSDGLQAQFTDFVYCGKQIRTFVRNWFIDYNYELPMWDMTLGMGSDPFITCVGMFNHLCDPLYWISAFIPEKYSEYAFDIIIILKLYLSGLSFLFLANEKGYKNLSAVAGALVYVFSSTTFMIFGQMCFSVKFIIFPLLLLGADRVWKGKNSIFYVVILTYSTILTYYFTYMMLILLVVYCVIRFFCEEGRSIKKFFSLFGRFVVLTLISLITGIGMILPSLINLLNLKRLKTHNEIEIINLAFFKSFLSYGFTCIGIDGGALIGISSFIAISAICLLVFKKKETIIKWCLLLCIISFAFPFIGSVFNGFSVPTTRYIFALLLCVAYMVTVSFDSIQYFKGIMWYITLIASILYGAICFFFLDRYSFSSAVSLMISTVLVGSINLFDRYINQIRNNLYIFVILISCSIIGYACINECFGSVLVDNGTAYEKLFLSGGMDLRRTVDDPKYRTDTLNTDYKDIIMNSSSSSDVRGFDFYGSNQNQNVEDYYSALAVLGNPMGFAHTGFRGRCYLEILNACNYLVRSNDNSTCIKAPYTYDYVMSSGNYNLYKSNRGVSLVYFYDDVISYESYMELNPVERETNLIYSMVVDNPKQPEANIISEAILIPFEITDYSNVSVDGDKINVHEKKGYITLKPDTIESGQISILLSGLKSSNIDNWHYRNSIVLMNNDNEPIVADHSAQFPTTYQYYTGNDDIVFSFESIEEEVNTIRLYFHNVGEYNLDDIQIYSRPYKQMDQTLEAFYEHADMEDIVYDYSGNHLSISATADSDSYLYIGIPYSEGWSAKVDGRPAEVMRANIAFMSIPVTSGTHSIELTYTTPHMYLGWTISAIGLLMIIGYMFYENKKRIRAS